MLFKGCLNWWVIFAIISPDFTNLDCCKTIFSKLLFWFFKSLYLYPTEIVNKNASIANITNDIAKKTSQIAKKIVQTADEKEFEGKNSIKIEKENNQSPKVEPEKSKKVISNEKIEYNKSHNENDEWESF